LSRPITGDGNIKDLSNCEFSFDKIRKEQCSKQGKYSNALVPAKFTVKLQYN